MDYRTLKSSEILPTSIFQERHDMRGQTVSINYSASQQWYYLDKQKTSEVTFIKIWDSKEDVARSKFTFTLVELYVGIQTGSNYDLITSVCAHCAFPHPDALTDTPPRESIEVRCLVFYEN